MKTRAFVTILILLIASTARMNAQCGSMKGHKQMDHGSMSHEHGDQSKGNEFTAVVGGDGKQQVNVVIKGGYDPSTIIVQKDIPVVLNFDLQEKSCTGTVVIKDLNITKEITPNKITAVEFIPTSTGSFAFTCPMEMIHGTIVVKD